jgi:hypothetical protein
MSENVKMRIYKTNFAGGYVWVRNSVPDIKKGTLTDSARKKGAEGNIWTEKGYCDKRLKKTA